MDIDINQLSEAQLLDLNRRIVERLRFLQTMRAHVQMLEFKIGDRVMFWSDARTPVTGILIRYNQKTVTVLTDDGHRWNVSPGLLRPAGSPGDAAGPPTPPRLE